MCERGDKAETAHREASLNVITYARLCKQTHLKERKNSKLFSKQRRLFVPSVNFILTLE
jgi:hypothetical protein